MVPSSFHKDDCGIEGRGIYFVGWKQALTRAEASRGVDSETLCEVLVSHAQLHFTACPAFSGHLLKKLRVVFWVYIVRGVRMPIPSVASARVRADVIIFGNLAKDQVFKLIGDANESVPRSQ
jgi:hypothetical protein